MAMETPTMETHEAVRSAGNRATQSLLDTADLLTQDYANRVRAMTQIFAEGSADYCQHYLRWMESFCGNGNGTSRTIHEPPR